MLLCPNDGSEVLTYRAAAGLLGVPVGTLQAWIATGRVAVPHVRYSVRTVRFLRADLLAWREARRQAAVEGFRDHVHGAGEDR